MNVIEKLRADGYPFKIKGNDGYEATLVGIQPLIDGEYEAIYRYEGGDCVHHLSDIPFFEIIEQ